MSPRDYRLRRESPDPPPFHAPLVAEPVVQPVQAALPELHAVRSDPIPTPERRSGHVLPGILGVEAREALQELVTGGQFAALARGPGPEPGLARPRGEVGVGFLVADARD